MFSIPNGWTRNLVSLVTQSPMRMADKWFQMQARFTTMCHVIADTSTIAHSLRPQQAPGGGDYYSLHFDVILLFGLTELRAQISWNDQVRLVILSGRKPKL